MSGVHIDERDVNCWRHCSLSLSLSLHLDVRLLLFLTDSQLYYFNSVFTITDRFHLVTHLQMSSKRLSDDCNGTILGRLMFKKKENNRRETYKKTTITRQIMRYLLI